MGEEGVSGGRLVVGSGIERLEGKAAALGWTSINRDGGRSKKVRGKVEQVRPAERAHRGGRR